jgi:PKD repeat protein
MMEIASSVFEETVKSLTDPLTEEEKNPPPFTYTTPGTYTVTLEACNVVGCTEFSQAIEILPTPVASFTFEADWLEITFTNASLYGDTYLWDFGDGITSTEMSPIHTYAAAGSYNVVLTVVNGCGVSTFEAVVTVEVCQAPVASFTFEPDFLAVTFTNTSVNGVSFEWDFGDGITSTEENPVHTYAEAGTYTVTLTVVGDCGVATFEAVVTVEQDTFFYVLPVLYKAEP